MSLRSIECDLRYAIRQLRDHADIERALDALSRIEECVEEEGAASREWDGVTLNRDRRNRPY